MAAFRALRTIRGRRLGRLPLYEDITPSSRWEDGTNGRSFVIDLPGFKKEEVNLEIDESGNVTIKGRHDVGNNRFRRFSLTVKAPEDTEMKEIVGDLEGGLYTVLFPKMVVAGAVQEEKLGDGGGEETEPEQKKHLDADKGLETTVLGTESSKVMWKEAVAEESSKEAVADAAVIQAERELVETAEKKPEAEINKTETIRAEKEKIMEKTLATGIPEAEKEKTRLPQSSIRMEETAIQKPAETATQKPETETNPAQTAAIQEPKTETRPAETVTKPEETNSSSEIPKAAAPKTATILPAIKDGAHKQEGIKKDGGFLENVMEKINEHKACIISAILAFSMGILISRKFRK